MRLRFLGTGTSFGVPVIGCTCDVCTSTDPRDRRTRHAAVVESDDGASRVLVDTPPELRLQLLAAGVSHIDAIWFTHEHADHTHGIDDIRVFSARMRRHVTAYASAETADALRHRFRYIFDPDCLPPAGTTRPELTLSTIIAGIPVDVAGLRMTPLEVPHGDMKVYGFRAGRLGYITDAKELPDTVRAQLDGVDVLVLNALWHGNPHPTHFNVEEAVAAARSIGAARTFFTHLTHRLHHATLAASLPDGMAPAHDGLIVEIPE